jgi:long-chain acyl-CoA synthetase
LSFARSPNYEGAIFNNRKRSQSDRFKPSWFDSKLGYVTEWGDLVLTGRAKDTIVPNNGENIEPLPIKENTCLNDPYIPIRLYVGRSRSKPLEL